MNSILQSIAEKMQHLAAERESAERQFQSAIKRIDEEKSVLEDQMAKELIRTRNDLNPDLIAFCYKFVFTATPTPDGSLVGCAFPINARVLITAYHLWPEQTPPKIDELVNLFHYSTEAQNETCQCSVIFAHKDFDVVFLKSTGANFFFDHIEGIFDTKAGTSYFGLGHPFRSIGSEPVMIQGYVSSPAKYTVIGFSRKTWLQCMIGFGGACRGFSGGPAFLTQFSNKEKVGVMGMIARSWPPKPAKENYDTVEKVIDESFYRASESNFIEIIPIEAIIQLYYENNLDSKIS